jgi:mono/diheme cytochrome c family protein
VARHVVWGTLATGAALVSVAFAAGHQPELHERRSAFMRAHFADAIRTHDAVARGDLDAARSHAQRLAAHKPDVPFPTGWHAFATLMVNAAREIEAAATLEGAAGSTAVLLTRCGECHQAQGAVGDVARQLGGGAAGTMRDHQAAADLLLTGLVQPSASSWDQGVEAFGRIRLPQDGMPTRELRAQAVVGDARFTAFAAQAAKAVRPPDRARVYGRVLSTCASCHREHRVDSWGPDRRPPP